MKRIPSTEEGLKEHAHGSQNFPLQIYAEEEHNENGLVIYNHWHDEAEILWITDGIMEVVVDGISILAPKDTVILIPPNLLHVGYQYETATCRFTSVVFHPDFIASKNQDMIQTEQLIPFLDNAFVTSYVMYDTDRKHGIVRQLLQELTQSYCQPCPYRELLMKGFLYQLLFHLLQKEEKYNLRSVSDYIKEDRKKKILNFINDNYQNPLTLDDLAGSVQLSTEQFCRFFKQSFRATPVQYLNQYRINRSMDLLKQTDLPIIEIAIEVGFYSSNYFAISFKKATGMTPGQFRNIM